MPPSELTIIEAQGEQLGSGLESVGYLQLDPETPAYALGIDAQGRPNKATSSLPKSALAHIRAGVEAESRHRGIELPNASQEGTVGVGVHRSR